MNAKRIAATIAIALVGAAALAGCSNGATVPEPTDTATSAMQVPDDPTTAPVAGGPTTAPPTNPTTPPPPPADENSQVIDGVLYQGTPIAPVRIGDDTPGEAPQAEQGFTSTKWQEYAQNANKYVVSVFQTRDGGWIWKVFGLSRHGSFRELGNSGYQAGHFLSSREEAAAGPFIVDGRELDRAEYILHVN